jgi:hypothetical protein
LLAKPKAASKIGIHMAKSKKSRDKHPQPAFLFDLDGTLIDSVYQHILSRSEPCTHWISSLPIGSFTAASE